MCVKLIKQRPAPSILQRRNVIRKTLDFQPCERGKKKKTERKRGKKEGRRKRFERINSRYQRYRTNARGSNIVGEVSARKLHGDKAKKQPRKKRRELYASRPGEKRAGRAGENRTGKQEGRIVPPDFAVPAETAERTSSDRKAGHDDGAAGKRKKDGTRGRWCTIMTLSLREEIPFDRVRHIPGVPLTRSSGNDSLNRGGFSSGTTRTLGKTAR